MRAVQVTQFGGPEVLTLADVPEPSPDHGQLLIEVSHAGVNYADTHQAENTYLAEQQLPMTPGMEVVGRTGADRRVVSLVGSGGYAERVLAPDSLTYDIPDEVDGPTAAALPVQGATAWFLLRRSVTLRPGESVVVHAAAGGVGSIAVQLAKAYGAGRVIATASSEEKRQLARDLGADTTVDATTEDMAGALRAANGGEPVDIVLDMTGGRITDESLAALAPLGRLGFFGMASRQPPEPVQLPTLLASSVTVAGFWLTHALARPELMSQAMAELLDAVTEGSLRVIDGGVYPLSRARQAHEDLRARRTVGKLTLDPTR